MALRTLGPLLHPSIPIAAQRQTLDRRGRPASPDATLQPIDAGGVPSEWVNVPTSTDAVVLHLHGGGYTLGSTAAWREFASLLARAAEARVLLPGYRLAPEHPLPAALNDALTTYRYLLRQGLQPQRIALTGDSAGGGLALATLLALRNAGDPLPAACVTISAWTDLALEGESVLGRAHLDPLYDQETLAAMAAAYLGSVDAHDPHASPLYADLTGLPPLYMLVGTSEILYDDTIPTATKARAAGVDVRVEEGPDLPHVYPLYAAMLPEGQRALARIGEFIRLRTTPAAARL